MELLKSASKIVFLLVALTACLGLFTGHIKANEFMTLAAMAFGFYFAYKGENSTKYAGK